MSFQGSPLCLGSASPEQPCSSPHPRHYSISLAIKARHLMHENSNAHPYEVSPGWLVAAQLLMIFCKAQEIVLLSGSSSMGSCIHRGVLSGSLKGIPLQTCRTISLCRPFPSSALSHSSRLLSLLNASFCLLDAGRPLGSGSPFSMLQPGKYL